MKGCAIVHADSGAVRGHVVNVCLGGVLLQKLDGAGDLDANRDVVVEIEVAGAGWVVQPGRVLRHDGRALAIGFGRLAPEVEDLIEDEVLGAVEAGQAPRVVVVDASLERRRRIADELRRIGCCCLEAATPLEALALVERSRNHVSAVALAETQTQTRAEELIAYLAEAHPGVRVVLIGDRGEEWLRELGATLRG